METNLNQFPFEVIRDLKKELGLRTEELVAQEPYKDLTPANQQSYLETKNRIEWIERRLTYMEEPAGYDELAGSGMDTFELSNNNQE